jgi:hypothetical protein
MSFEEFCKMNCMVDEEIPQFRVWLEKRKDNFEKREIQNWLYLFNMWYDNL